MSGNNVHNLLIFTQARLNSQRLPNKMLKKFGGRSLFDIACEKLAAVDFPSQHKWVSLYDEELKIIAKKHGINIYNRSQESANSDTNISNIWEICNLAYSNYVMFNPCLPFLKVETIERFIKKYEQLNFASLFGVKKFKDYLWGSNQELFFPPNTDILNTKDCEQLYLAAHALYAGRTFDIRNNIQLGDFKKGNPNLFVMEDKIECLDIDDDADWQIAESLWNTLQQSL
jgi:CMP-N-acetylneuraminic acid synthetase